jgi:hypothetical protein
MQQEKLVSSAKAKAAKAYARAEELCLKLKAAIKASMGCNNTTSPSLDMVHSHKKSKGTARVSTESPVVQLHQYLSPQREDTTVNKRVDKCPVAPPLFIWNFVSFAQFVFRLPQCWDSHDWQQQ